MTQHIQEACNIDFNKEIPTKLYEDNVAHITQLIEGYIKRDKKKHISLKLFFTNYFQKNKDIDIQKIYSKDNLTDLLTKVLLTLTFEKLIYKIELYQLKDIK